VSQLARIGRDWSFALCGRATIVPAMKMLCAVVSLLAIVLPSLPAGAQVLDAPTGTYKGTLVHQRRLTLKQTDPPRVVSYKQKTKVTGFGYVPQGGTRTFIQLIIPPRAFRDAGLDSGLTLDFNPTPPELTILDGSSALTFPFPTITVDGNVVTVQAFVAVNTPDYEIADTRTLSLKRSKP
jgi:hypothetical protein